MQIYAVSKGDLWLNCHGRENFTPHFFTSRARAERVASQGGGVVKVYEAVEIECYTVPEPVLPTLPLVKGSPLEEVSQ